LQAFLIKDLHEAEMAFQRVAEHSPEDKPTQFYLREIQLLRANPQGADPHGVVNLSEF
jgi:hypothetical protein